MRKNLHPLQVCLLVLTLTAGCRCGTPVAKVPPSLKVSPLAFDFGPVKLGARTPATFKLEAQTKSPVSVSAVKLANRSAPGGAEGFSVVAKPATIDSLSFANLELTFAPTVLQAYEADLTIESDDPDRPTITVLLTGEGSKAQIQVIPDCAASRKCVGTVTVTPPSIDFGAEPFVRLLPVDVSALPSVNIVNNGLVELRVGRFAIEGPDALAFTCPGNCTVPDGGLALEPAAGVNLALRFKPTSDIQNSYSAEAVVQSDDPDRPQVKVALSGTLRPNFAPTVCANLIKVQPIDDAERDYSSKAEWATLLVAPDAGYDFTTRRDVEPRSVAIFSAWSDSADQTTCTSDPEDGRIGLTYLWTLESAPVGATNLGISGATSAQATLRPIVTGEYTLKLQVMDTQLHSREVLIKFAVAQKQDLVAQLQWTGFADTDLDLHLVRPSAVTAAADPFSGAFATFQAGDAGKTSGDINGYSVIKQKNTPGFDFDWGAVGTPDDPRQNLDDLGSGPLLENISLNYPENDPKCASAPCTYKVMVHYFKDSRPPMAAGGCSIDGGLGSDGGLACADGLACGCASPQRCVADSAPKGDAGTGIGKCYLPPKPVVRIFLKGSAIPAQIIPLDTLVPPDQLALGAPCQLLYVADVEWPGKNELGMLPDGGTRPANIFVKGADLNGRIVSPLLARYGWRQAGGSLQCSPDTTFSSGGVDIDWYSRQP